MKRIRSLLAPVSEDKDVARREYVLNVMLFGLISLDILFVIGVSLMMLLGIPSDIVGPAVGLGLLPIYGLSYWLGRRGKVTAASYVMVLALFVGMVGANVRMGLGHSPILGYAMVVSLAGLLIGVRSAAILALLSAVVYAAIGYLQVAGRIEGILSPDATILADAVAVGGGLGVLVVLNWIMGEQVSRSLSAERRLTAELRANQQELEQRVAERTAELERRAEQLEVATEVSRAVASVLDLDELLSQVATVVREQFPQSYVGIFLVDDEERSAVLRASAGEADPLSHLQDSRLDIGGESKVGRCVAWGESFYSLSSGKEGESPARRSEVVLPLRSRGQVIGAIALQSPEGKLFDEGDVAALRTVADYVAVAIDNARLFAETQSALSEMESLQRRYARRTWSDYLLSVERTWYETELPGVPPLSDAVWGEVRQAIERGMLVRDAGADDDKPAALVVPISLRGQVVGVVGVRDEEGMRRWTEDDVAVIRAIVERMALAADNLRLLDETQRRAARERLVGEISARLRASLDPDVVLRTMVRELGSVLGAEWASIEITGPEAEEGLEETGNGHGVVEVGDA